MLTCTVFDLIQFSVSADNSIGIGIGIGQYYWVLGIGCLTWYRSNPICVVLSHVAVGPLTPGSRMMPMSPQDPATQLNTFKTYVTLIADSTPGSK